MFCIGINVADTFPLMEVLGRKVAIVNAFYSGGQLLIGIAEDGWQWDEEGWDALSFAILVGAVFAVGGGLVTVGIGVYS